MQEIQTVLDKVDSIGHAIQNTWQKQRAADPQQIFLPYAAV